MVRQSLSVKSLKKAYSRHFFVFNNVTVTFKQGMSYAITGISGSGKTTLLHIMAGIEFPTAGSVILMDHDIYNMTQEHREQFLHKQFGLVFQSPYLIKELSVLENVMLKGIIGNKHVIECQEEAYALLASVGLQDRAHDRPTELSGGQQQRVALARALFGKPSFLLADEPTGNLDPDTGQRIVDLMLKFQDEYSMGLIISSHSSYVIQKMQVCYEVCNGNLIEYPSLIKASKEQESEYAK